MMQINATDAKNRFGQMLDACLTEPVFIAKSGRQHGVLLSMQQYQMLQSRQLPDPSLALRQAASPVQAFYAQCWAWVDEVNGLVEQHGVWSDGLMQAPSDTI